MPRYYEYLKNQTKEILDNYGPLGIMWFDGEWEKPWTQEYGNELYRYLKRIQPGLIINNRVSKGRHGMAGTTKQSHLNAGDYDTPEQRVGGFNRERPWETCMTICRQWAWKPNDQMKSKKQCIQTLLQTVGGDGNLLFSRTAGSSPARCSVCARWACGWTNTATASTAHEADPSSRGNGAPRPAKAIRSDPSSRENGAPRPAKAIRSGSIS